MNSRFEKSARVVLTNAERLIDETANLEYEDHPTTSFYLLQLAQEEAAKAFILALVFREVIPWDNHVLRACQDHKCKQLVVLVMDYLNPPDLDEDYRKHLEKMLNRAIAKIPPKVADAIHILRYEKIGRWKSNQWVWAEDPLWDRDAMQVAQGASDAFKQDAIYVRLARDGSVAHAPAQLKVPKYSEQRDSASRMIQVVQSLLGERMISSYILERIERIFKTLFTETDEVRSV